MLATNDLCTLETCEKDRRETYVKNLAGKELLAKDISPMKLTEMISNSIKEAVQTIVEKCSMEEENVSYPHWREYKNAPHVRRSRIVKQHCKKISDTCNHPRIMYHVPRQYNNLPVYRNYPHSYNGTHEDTISLPAKNKNDRKTKQNSKSNNNANTDNRRMTGNVNIYICSEANEKSQVNVKKKPQFCTDTSSDSITERSSSQCISASSVSSCRLINSIREIRKKRLQSQQMPDSNQNNQKDKIDSNNDDNNVHDEISSKETRQEQMNETRQEQMNVRIIDEDCKETTPSTRDGCCCEDTSDADLQQRGSLDSVIPCSGLSVCDDSKQSRSWTEINPSEAKANEVSSPNEIYNDMERIRSCRKNGNNDVCRNDGEYTVCRAVDGSDWLPKSIYTSCATSKVAKECFAYSRKCRNKKLQVSSLNHNAIQRKQVGYKSARRSSGTCQREHVTRQWSTCSCIAEEEEDYCTNVDTAEQRLPENLYDVTERMEKISVCRTLSSESTKNATGTPFKETGEPFEKTRTCVFRDFVEFPRETTVCATTLENSEESPKVIRVCQFVSEKPRQDIAVCGTIFAEAKEPPKKETVCKTKLPDIEKTPKEIICKIADSNFIEQVDVNKMIPLNNAKERDKLVEEKIDANSNDKKKNDINFEKAVVRSDDKYNSLISTDLIKHKPSKDVKQDETILNNQSNIRAVSVGQIKNSKPLSKNIYSMILSRAENQDPNLASNHNAKEVLNAFNNRQRARRTQLSPFYQPIKNNFQESNKISKVPTMRDFVQNKDDRTKEEILEKPREEKEDIPNRTEVIKEKPKDATLYRPIKRLFDVIKLKKIQHKDEIKKGEQKAETITDKTLNVMKLKNEKEIEIKTKINNEKNDQDINKEIHVPMTSQLASKQETIRNAVHVETSKPTAPIVDSIEQDKKIDISKMIRATRLNPKLLRIITMKKMYSQRTEATAKTQAQDRKTEPISAEITINEHDQEKISRKSALAEAMKEIKTEKPIVPEISTVEIKDISKDIADVPKDITNMSMDIIGKESLEKVTDEAVEFYKTSSQEELEQETQELISCKCGTSIDPSNIQPRVFVEYTKCNNSLKDRPCIDNEFQQEEVCRAHRYSLMEQCAHTPTQRLKACLKIDKPRFRSVSFSKNDSHACTSRCGITKECKRRNIVVCPHSRRSDGKCKCRMCETYHLKSIDKCKCRAAIKCSRSKDKCYCAIPDLVEYHKIKRCHNKKTMICLYCNNPQDKCTCKATIRKCSCCKLPLDVCDYQHDENHDRRRVIERSNENTIQVTSWKPKEEIRRYFARNRESRTDSRSDVNEEYRRHEKAKRQRLEELPYQRLNVFSDVMNELQRKISESVCCARCKKNPCCCGSRVDQDGRKKESQVEDYVRCLEVEKSKGSSSNSCRCSSSSRKEQKDIVSKSMQTQSIGCNCRLSSCRCRRSGIVYKESLAKCCCCKSLHYS